MGKYILVLHMLLLLGCNNSLPSRVDIVESGTARQEITITLGFIDQLKELCQDVLAPVNYNTEQERKSAVAQCVFNNIASLGKVPEIVSLCSKQNKTPEEILICQTMGM